MATIEASGLEKGSDPKNTIEKYPLPVPDGTSGTTRRWLAQEALEQRNLNIYQLNVQLQDLEWDEVRGAQGIAPNRRLIPDSLFSNEGTDEQKEVYEKRRNAYDETLRAISNKEKSLNELLADASKAASEGDKSKLVAMKMLGARLLQLGWGGEVDNGWKALDNNQKLCVQLAESIIAGAEARAIAAMSKRGEKVPAQHFSAQLKHFKEYNKRVGSLGDNAISHALAVLENTENKARSGKDEDVLAAEAARAPGAGDTGDAKMDDTIKGKQSEISEEDVREQQEIETPVEIEGISRSEQSEGKEKNDSPLERLQKEVRGAKDELAILEQAKEDLPNEREQLLTERTRKRAQLAWMNGYLGIEDNVMPKGFRSDRFFDAAKRLEYMDELLRNIEKNVSKEKREDVRAILQEQKRIADPDNHEEFKELFTQDKARQEEIRKALNAELVTNYKSLQELNTVEAGLPEDIKNKRAEVETLQKNLDLYDQEERNRLESEQRQSEEEGQDMEVRRGIGLNETVDPVNSRLSLGLLFCLDNKDRQARMYELRRRVKAAPAWVGETMKNLLNSSNNFLDHAIDGVALPRILKDPEHALETVEAETLGKNSLVIKSLKDRVSNMLKYFDTNNSLFDKDLDCVVSNELISDKDKLPLVEKIKDLPALIEKNRKKFERAQARQDVINLLRYATKNTSKNYSPALRLFLNSIADHLELLTLQRMG